MMGSDTFWAVLLPALCYIASIVVVTRAHAVTLRAAVELARDAQARHSEVEDKFLAQSMATKPETVSLAHAAMMSAQQNGSRPPYPKPEYGYDLEDTLER